MTWIAWQRQRVVIAVWLAAMAGFIVYLVVVGHAVQVDTRAALAAKCGTVSSTLYGSFYFLNFGHCTALSSAAQSDWSQASAIRQVLVLLPALAGVVLGAPLVAGELERRTNRFMWTQGISRTRWLVVKGAVAAVAAVLPFAVIAALMPWWRGAVSVVHPPVVGPPIAPMGFAVTGIVLPAYALFAVALGAAAGALVRRVSAAVVLGVAAYGGTRWLVQVVLRPRFLPPDQTAPPVTLGPRLAFDHKLEHAWVFPSSLVARRAFRLRRSSGCAAKAGTILSVSVPMALSQWRTTSLPPATGRSRGSSPGSSWWRPS